ncbi:fatty acyl-CoA reductase wat-like [Agrilus planipennis]|uniref:Fatty acyl-CoA reductase wat-like n=1 Tax=Agrilus planipennis TaxID=224129 RepID=A0A7F5RNI8_AGRPL|nr:fatty acyl-CoA reductase wat-like [Agrilus planipennis]
MPTYQEPLSGWAGNLYGPIGITVGVAMGLLKALYIKPLNVADIVPADFVVNCIISAAWDISIDREPATYSGNKDNRIKIYNCVSGPQNPVLWEKTWKYTETLGKSIPSKTCLWYYFFVPAPSERIYKIYITFLHIIPAYIVDFVAMLTGRKPQLVKTYKKIHKFCDVLQYFTTRQWKFENENTKNLWKKLNAEDKTVFPFSMKLLNWKDYFEVCIRGVRLYIFKDPMDTLEEGKAHYRRLKIYHYSVITIVIILLIAFVYYFFKTVFNILF